ncbi:MAG: hypothetical protein H7Y86_05365 [Rhizobacter sp.]|nr:hypothetical protein [Ferruginibacter sp.]
MKKFFLMMFVLATSQLVNAQKATVAWGGEFKMKKGSTDLSVIQAEKDGIYLKEGHAALKSYFVIGATTRESATLVKLDNSLEEVYRNDFNKELKGKDYEDFFFLQGKLFLLATKYDKGDKRLSLHAAEISKADGALTGEWTEIDSWSKESNKEVINFKADYNGDSSHMIVASTVEGKEKNIYNITAFDAKLKKVGKAVQISNEFEPKTFQLEDIVYATNGNILMVGREMEYQEGKKKKTKFLDFKNYLVRIYQPDGRLLKEINTNVDGKWLLSTKVSQIKGRELVLAAFYSNTKKGREVNGMMVQRIDPANGEIISTSRKELNTALISAVDDGNDDDDESKQERKERERLEKIKAEEDGFSRNFRFRNFIPTSDGGLAILAEEYNSYSYSVYQAGGGSSMSGFSGGRWVTYRVYSSGDIMMSKVDASGNLGWLHVLPKNQEERIEVGNSNMGFGFSVGFDYFDNTLGFPFYSGFAGMPVAGKNSIVLLFNDGSKNADVTKLGQKVRRTMRFSKSDCYQVTLDSEKGSYTRTTLFTNDDIPPAMPRLGTNLGNVFFVVGRQERLLGKSKIAVGKVTFK